MSNPSDLVLEYQNLQIRLDSLGRRWICDNPQCDGKPHAGWLHKHARSAQQEPMSYTTWLILSGRGYGKTRTGAETCRKWEQEGNRHIAVIAKTDREVRNICFDGPAGLLKRYRPDEIRAYNASAGSTKLVLKSGTVFRAFSSENPDTFRGYAFDKVWADEYAAWSKNTAQEAMDMLWFCLREASDPRVLITTTPKRLAHIQKMVKRAETDSNIIITRGSIRDNLDNLNEATVDELYSKYAGTRLGRQELEGELLEDVEGALWTLSMIEEYRLRKATENEDGDVLPRLVRIVVGVDPAGSTSETADHTGIIVVGLSSAGHYYVLDDGSIKASPDGWGRRVVHMYRKWVADRVVGERNFGGDMVESTLRQVDATLSYKDVRASRGKLVRAEPVSALYEQGKVHHVGVFPELESEMTQWTEDSDDSPDRLDALVWAITELMENSRTMLQLAGMVIHCPNSACGLPNSKSAKRCFKCGTELGEPSGTA